MRSCKICKTLNFEPLLLRIEISQLLFSAICPECPKKVWRRRVLLANTHGSAQEVAQAPYGLDL